MLKKETFGQNNAEFHHIGLVVSSIKDYLNSDDNEIFFDPIQRVYVSFIELNGIEIELIEPKDKNSPVNNNLERKYPLAHLCYEVSDMDNAINEGRKNGFHCIAKPVGAVAFKGRKIAWLYNKDIGLVEILEKY